MNSGWMLQGNDGYVCRVMCGGLCWCNLYLQYVMWFNVCTWPKGICSTKKTFQTQQKNKSYPISNMHVCHFVHYFYALIFLLSCSFFFLNITLHTILACRHGNMDMRCIHLSNKKKRGSGGMVWGRHVFFVFTHTQTCQTSALFFHPLQPSVTNYVSLSQDTVSCVLPAHPQTFSSRVCYRDKKRRRRVIIT